MTISLSKVAPKFLGEFVFTKPITAVAVSKQLMAVATQKNSIEIIDPTKKRFETIALNAPHVRHLIFEKPYILAIAREKLMAWKWGYPQCHSITADAKCWQERQKRGELFFKNSFKHVPVTYFGSSAHYAIGAWHQCLAIAGPEKTACFLASHYDKIISGSIYDNFAATGDSAGRVKMWNLPLKDEMGEIRDDHLGPITHLACSEKILVMGSGRVVTTWVLNDSAAKG